MKVLLFNLDAQNDTGENLQKLLATSSGHPVQLRHESVPQSRLPDAPRLLSRILATFVANIILPVFGELSLPCLPEVLEASHTGGHSPPIVAVLPSDDPHAVKRALSHGANDYVVPPLRAVDLLPRLWRWLDSVQQEEQTVQNLKEKLGLQELIGESPLFLAQLKKIQTFRASDATVLITGETGTGKELCARAVHYLSSRSDKPFVALNCGTIPDGLVENELFGHQPGAFTGANSSALGVVHEAQRGTLFLDEVDSLPLSAQISLLRLLQEREFKPVGSSRSLKSDLRIIAASNANLEQKVASGNLRQDLYYRLNVLTLTLPALRERPGDIALLCRHFLSQFISPGQRLPKQFSPAALHNLALYHWPGNVRQLQNLIQRAVVHSQHPVIDAHEIDLPCPADHTRSLREIKAAAIAEIEQKWTNQFLAAWHGNISKAAEAAQIHRRAFLRLMHKYDISPEKYKQQTPCLQPRSVI